MHTKITIEKLPVYVQIGMYNWEKVIKQEVVLDVCISYNICSSTSCIKCKVDYHELCMIIKKVAIQVCHELLEDFVKHVLEFLVSNYANILECRVTALKSMATMGMAKISCTMHCSKENHGICICN